MNRAGRAGVAILAALGIVGLLAPCLAGGLPLLVIGGGSVRAPALRAVLSPLASGGPVTPGASVPEGAWVLGPPISHDPLAIDLARRLEPPGRAHWLGTDELGRDVASRLIHAVRPSLLVALAATVISLLLGLPIGAAAGYGSARVDATLSRLIEASLSFPALILLMLLTSLAVTRAGPEGGPSVGPARSLLVVGAAVGIARWASIARYMRGEVLRLSRTEMALSARAAGATATRILARHLVPAGLAPVAVSAAFGAGTAVAAEASLSFLGLGVQPPVPTWGQTIASAALVGARHWWLLVFPGIMVAVTVAGFNLIGEGLRRGRRT